MTAAVAACGGGASETTASPDDDSGPAASEVVVDPNDAPSGSAVGEAPDETIPDAAAPSPAPGPGGAPATNGDTPPDDLPPDPEEAPEAQPERLAYLGPGSSPTISGDGNFVLFSGNSILDVVSGRVQQITVADLGLDEEGFVLFLDSTSADGRFLTFTYVADGTDAIAPETTNFLYDRSDGSVVNLRDSLPSAADGPIALSSVISPDGRHVAFTVFDQVLEAEPEPFSIHGLWIYDHLSGTAFEVLPRSSGRSLQFAEPLDFSEDGRFLLFAALDQDLLTADVNAGWDFFLYDQTTGITELVSVPVLDAEPRVADQDEFFTPRPSGEISLDGRFVVFQSEAGNLVRNDTNDVGDVFLRDRVLGETRLVSVATDGGQADVATFAAATSGNGSVIIFSSRASTLVQGDVNDQFDLFVHYPETVCTLRISEAASGIGGDGISFFSSVRDDGAAVVFSSASSNLLPSDPRSDAGGLFVASLSTSCE